MSDERHGEDADEQPKSDEPVESAAASEDDQPHGVRPRPDLYKLAAVDSSKLFTGIDTSKFFAGIDTSKVIAGIDTTNWVTAIDTSKLFTGIDTSNIVKTIDTSKFFAGIDTSKVIAGIDTTNWVTAIDTSKLFTGIDITNWVTTIDTSKLFRNIGGNLDSAVNWGELSAAIDWSTLDERIEEIEQALDETLPPDDVLNVNLDAAVEQVLGGLAATGQSVSRRQARQLILIAIAVYIATALALHVTNALSIENPVFDPHKLVTDQAVAIGLALAVYGAFKKKN